MRATYAAGKFNSDRLKSMSSRPVTEVFAAQAVTRHLGVPEAAGLARCQRRARERVWDRSVSARRDAAPVRFQEMLEQAWPCR